MPESRPAPPEAEERDCLACAARSRASTFTATERLLDSGETFAYWTCPACGCVQIAQVPADLARHYPASYFAFRPQHRLAASRLRRWLDPHRLRAATGGKDLLGAIANRVLKPLDFAPWCTVMGLGAGARVLDVGCGAGKLLLRLRHAGFARCLGLDPFLDAPLRYANGVEVLDRGVEALAGDAEERFDLVMFHHSLEHTPEPLAQLRAARSLLARGGWVLVRIPVAGGYAWRTYREHWVALDPPRHLFVPTETAMSRLAGRAGLAVRHTDYDSTAMQFEISEMYRAQVSPSSPRGRAWRVAPEQRRRWQEQAAALNAARDGDQAAFFLRAA
jgi:2-polyprenyl-3-methyl-5-hydroxy-6-metoxy-1,4-benzoquinol methylase